MPRPAASRSSSAEAIIAADPDVVFLAHTDGSEAHTRRRRAQRPAGTVFVRYGASRRSSSTSTSRGDGAHASSICSNRSSMRRRASIGDEPRPSSSKTDDAHSDGLASNIRRGSRPARSSSPR